MYVNENVASRIKIVSKVSIAGVVDAIENQSLFGCTLRRRVRFLCHCQYTRIQFLLKRNVGRVPHWCSRMLRYYTDGYMYASINIWTCVSDRYKWLLYFSIICTVWNQTIITRKCAASRIKSENRKYISLQINVCTNLRSEKKLL